MELAYKLVAIDLDGTLLNSRGELSKRNRQALHHAHEAGMVVCLCTGRSLTEARPVIEQIGLDLAAGVFVFGAIVADLARSQTLFRNAMRPELTGRLVGHLQERGHPVLVLYDSAEASCDYLLVEGSRNREAYDRWLAFAPARTERCTAWSRRPYAPLRVGIIEHPDRIQATLGELQAVFPPGEAKINSIYAPNYGLHVVECFSPEVSKWHGITQLAHRIGVELHRVAAIGDDINDLEMISKAGLGVAMGNAIPSIKAVATSQVPTNDRDGVSTLIDDLLLGQVQSHRRARACRQS